MSRIRTIVTLFFLTIGHGSLFFLPYIRNVYYDPMLQVMGVNHGQFGTLVSLFAIVTMVLYIPGGIIVDKWDYKKCIVASLFSTAVLVVSFAFYMTFAYARVVWMLLAVTTTFVFWSAALKAVRMLGTKDTQGSIYGIYYGLQGVLGVTLANVNLSIFHSFGNQLHGLRFLMGMNAGFLVLSGIMCAILLPSQKEMNQMQGISRSFNFKMVGQVLKNPLIWLITIMFFCAYGLYSNSYYYSGFLTNLKGLSAYWGQQLALIRVNYALFGGSLLGGFIVTRMKSTTKWFVVCAVLSTVSVITFISMMGSGANVTALAVVSVLPSLFMLLVYGTLNSLYQEYGVPIEATGTAIGIVAIIGYAPDLIFQPILGGFLDSAVKAAVIKAGVPSAAELEPAVMGAAYGAGFAKIFMFFLVVTVVGIAASILALIILKNRKAKAAAEPAAAAA